MSDRDKILTTPLDTPEQCRLFHGIDCQVDGCAGNNSVKCSTCDNRGYWEEDQFTPGRGHWTKTVPCPDCKDDDE